MSQAVQAILQQIQLLPEQDRQELEKELASLAEAEWQQEAEEARRIANHKSIDQAAIDKAVEKVRYGA